jgi:hypothetical protein
MKNQKCSHCKELKLTDLFYKNNATKSGFDYYCKKCRNAMNVRRAKEKRWAVTEKFRKGEIKYLVTEKPVGTPEKKKLSRPEINGGKPLLVKYDPFNRPWI